MRGLRIIGFNIPAGCFSGDDDFQHIAESGETADKCESGFFLNKKTAEIMDKYFSSF